MKPVQPDVWKWLAGVFFALVLSMGTYIYRIENRIEAKIKESVATEFTQQVAPIKIRIETLEANKAESRIERGDAARRIGQLENQFGQISQQLRSIDQTQVRILNRLEAIQ